MTDPKAIIDSRHPLYTTTAPLWQFFGDHYEGGPMYAQKSNPLSPALIGYPGDAQRGGVGRYVTRHSLEDGINYLARLSKSACVNLCAPAVDLLAGTVGNPDSTILDFPDDYHQIADDCDLTGASFLQFMSLARTHAATFGHVFLLCDSKRATGELITQADVLAQGIRPYFREILPRDLLNWRLDENGKPIEILFRVAVERPGSILDGAEHKEQHYEYRYWSREGWIVYRGEGDHYELVGTGDNPLKEIPITALYHKRIRPFLGESLLKESAKYSQMLTNWLSDLDQTMEMQSFSQACLKSADTPTQVGIGAAKVLHLRPDRKEGDNQTGAEDFFYRSPDSAPLQTMWDAFFRVVDLANESMSLKQDATTNKTQPESGISRAWRWHSTEKKLITMAVNEQEAARSLFHFAARWKGQENFPGSIVYGLDFDLNSLDQDIQAMLSLQTLGLPATAQVELKARAIRKALPNLDPRRQTEIDAELRRMVTSTGSASQ